MLGDKPGTCAGLISGVPAGTLTSDMKYWFRVNAVKAPGPGPWSNPVSARVK